MSIAGTIMLQLAQEGDQFFNAGRFAEAEQKYREMIRLVRLKPSDLAIALAKIGHSLYHRGNIAAAETTLVQATTSDPDSGYAWTCLAQFLATQDRIAESKEACGRALALFESAPDQVVGDIRGEAERLMHWHLSRRKGDAETLDDLRGRWSACIARFEAPFQQAEQLKAMLDQRSATAAAAGGVKDDLVKQGEGLLVDLRRARDTPYASELAAVAAGSAPKRVEAKALLALEQQARALDDVAQRASASEESMATALAEALPNMADLHTLRRALVELETTAANLQSECGQHVARLTAAAPAQPTLLHRANVLKAELDAVVGRVGDLGRALRVDWEPIYFPERIAPEDEERFSDDQIAAMVKDAGSDDELCRRHGITRQTLAGLRAAFAGKTIEGIHEIRQGTRPAPARRFRRKVDLELHVLAPMRATGLAFVRDLNARLPVIESDLALYTALAKNGVNLAAQLEELTAHRDEILETRRQACEILEALRPQRCEGLDEAAIAKIWDEQIVPVVVREQARLLRAKRPMGPAVDANVRKAENCEGRYNTALRDCVEILDKEFKRGPRYAQLWRWIARDQDGHAAIWLYHHHPSEKWKCLYFRIGIERIIDDVVFTLESHVNFGLGNDPTQYKIDQSRVYHRLMPGWSVTNENSKTFSTSNAVNVQRTLSLTGGGGVSRSVTQQQGVTLATSQSQSTSTSRGGNDSGSWSNCSAFSLPARSLQNSYSVGGGDSRSWGETTSDSTSSSEARNYGRSVAVQESINQSVAEAVSAGLSSTDGTSIQTTFVAFGPDFGVPEKELLAKWQNYNPDAAGIFRSVQHLFEAMCTKEIEHLQSMAKGRDAPPDEEPAACDAKIAAVMPVLYTRRGEDFGVAAVPPVTLIAGKPGPGGGARPR
jgi:hypothetical protein